jgi:hypothetical protein
MVYKYYEQSSGLQKELLKMKQAQRHDKKVKNHLA